MGAKKHGPSKDGMRAKYLDQVVPDKDRRDALQRIYEANRFFGGILLISLSDLHVYFLVRPMSDQKSRSLAARMCHFHPFLLNPPLVRRVMFALPDHVCI